MKKSKLLLVALCALPLAACSGGRSQTVMSTFSSGSKISKALIEQNNSSSVKLATVKQYAFPDGYEATHFTGDIYVISNDGGQTVSLYLLSESKVFASNVQVIGKVQSSGSYFLPYVLVKDASENYVTYAYNGVLVHSSTKQESSSSIRVLRDSENRRDLLYYPNENVYVAFDGKEGKLAYTTNFSDLDSEYINMEPYGRKEYTVCLDIYNSQVIVKKDNSEPSYYKLPYNALGLQELEGMFLIGDYLFFPQTSIVSDYNAEYQYERNGKRYIQTIGRFNYTNGSYEESVLNYVFWDNDITPIKDEQGNYTLAVACVKGIRENKVLNEATTSYFIVGSDLKLYDDVTYFVNMDGKGLTGVFQNTQIVEENGKVFYVNTSDLLGITTVYDQNFNAIRSSFNVRLQLMPGVMLAVNDGNYCGVINYKGEIVVPFKYQVLYGYADGKLIVGRQEGEEFKNYSVTYGLTAASYAETEIKDLDSVEVFETGELAVYHMNGEVRSVEFFGKNGSLLIKLDDISAAFSVRSYKNSFECKAYVVFQSISTDGKLTNTVFEYDIPNEVYY